MEQDNTAQAIREFLALRPEANIIYRQVDDSDEPQPWMDKETTVAFIRWMVGTGRCRYPEKAGPMIDWINSL
jgi:hypothetical protein